MERFHLLVPLIIAFLVLGAARSDDVPDQLYAILSHPSMQNNVVNTSSADPNNPLKSALVFL